MSHFLDWEAPEDHMEPAELIYVNWLNGKGEAFEAINSTIANGGFELPYEDWGGVLSGVLEPVKVPKKKGALLAYAFDTLHLSVIAQKKTWVTEDGENKTYSKDYTPGAKSRLHVFCLIKELCEAGFVDPVIFTVAGMAGKAFEKVVRPQHGRTVLRPAAMLGKAKSYPSYMFWTPVKAGPLEEVGKGVNTNTITPPAPAWDMTASSSGDKKRVTKLLLDLYIGDELRELVSGVLYEQGQTWLKQKVEPVVTEEGPAIIEETQATPTEDAPLFAEDEVPF